MIELDEPDKGRAWVVAIAACVINMILSGLSRMVSLLYVAIIEKYDVTRGEATLPFTVRNTVRCLSGPVLGIIGDVFGIKLITFVGGVMASAGAALCYLAPNVIWLTVFWGGIHGLGFSFANTLFQVVVNQYFQKYRATASGIALSGACIGSLGFPVLIEWILDTFGLSGGFLIIGGIVMHVLPAALLMSSPQWVEYPEAYARLWAKRHQPKLSIDTINTVVDAEYLAQSLSENNKEDTRKISLTMSLSNNPVESIGVSKASEDHGREIESGHIFDHSDEFGKRRVSLTGSLQMSWKSSGGYQNTEFQDSVCDLSLSEKDNFAHHTISGQIQSQSTELEIKDYGTTKTCPVTASYKTKTKLSASESFKKMIQLYKNPVFILISVCMCTYVIIFIPLLTVVLDYSKDKGFSSSYGTFLINAMAVGDLIGRLCFGWVTDRHLVTLPVFMFLVLGLQGAFVSLLPLASSLPLFVLVLVLYSVTAGTLIVIFPVLLFHFLDLNSQSVAVACYGFFAGIAGFGIPPMIGHFRDNIGSYDGMFLLTGAISIICGALWLLIPIMEKCKRTTKNINTAE